MSAPISIITRAAPADVIAVCDVAENIANLRPFILAANQLVTQVCASTGAFSAEQLKIIEIWLAAHFAFLNSPRYLSETIGAASATIQAGQMGMNLAASPYGQAAMLLDFKGGLAWLDQHISRGKRAVAGITYLGVNKRPWSNYPWRFLNGFTE